MTTAAQAAAKITLPGASATRDARMFRNSRAFVPRYQKFESISLQQTVRLSPGFASVRGKARVFSHYADRAGRQWSAETRKAQQRRAKQRWSLCRAIFLYRSVADGVRDGGGRRRQVRFGCSGFQEYR